MVNNINAVGNFNPHLTNALKNKEIASLQSQASKIFPFKNNSEILSGETLVFDFTKESAEYSAFVPFQNLKISNISNQPIYLYFGDFGEFYDFVPNNTTNVYSKQDFGGGLAVLKIYNAGTGTINTKEILLSVWNSGLTPTDAIQNVGNLFNKLPQKFNKWKIGVN